MAQGIWNFETSSEEIFEALAQAAVWLIIAPHHDDEIIGCGAFLSFLASKKPKQDIFIAYAVSGFRGVSGSLSRQEKIAIREKEANSCCKRLGARPIFWKLPFYESEEREASQEDVLLIERSINKINPDIIFLADEAIDPHGTHGLVREACFAALRGTGFPGTVFGYRVWQEGYESGDLICSFDETVMQEKEALLNLYESQIINPAVPHKSLSFLELMKNADKRSAIRHGSRKLGSSKLGSSLPYAECYKVIFPGAQGLAKMLVPGLHL